MMDILGSVGSFLGGVADVGTSIYNAFSQDRTYDYNKRVQQTTWNREDNAVQRRAADLEKAGLSKTLAAGSAASSSVASTLTAPQLQKMGISEKVALYKQISQMNANISKTEEDARLSKMKANIAQHDYNVLTGKESGIMSTDNSYMAELIKSLNALSGVTGLKKGEVFGNKMSNTVGGVLKSFFTGDYGNENIPTLPDYSASADSFLKRNFYPGNKAYPDKTYPEVVYEKHVKNWKNIKNSLSNSIENAFNSSEARMYHNMIE